MAACAKCGTVLPSDGPGFCPACGAPVAAVPPPLAAVPPIPVPGYAAAPPRSGNTALKVVLIVIAVAVGLGVLGMGAVGLIGYRALHSSGGSVSLGSGAEVSADDLGIEPYPGATRVDKGSVRMKIAGNSMVTSAFATNDSPEDVVKFYQDKLGASAKVESSAHATTLQRGVDPGENGDSLLITVSPNEHDGKTGIIIVHSQMNHPS